MSHAMLALQEAGAYGGFDGGWRAFAALVIVFGLLGALAWLARRGSLPGGFGRRASTTMRVESALPLGERRALVIVEVDGKRLLIGTSPASVSLIAELNARPFEAELGAAVARQPGVDR